MEYLPLITIPGPIVEIDETFIGSRMRSSIGRVPKKHHVIFGNLTVKLVPLNFIYPKGLKCRSSGRLLIFLVPDKSSNSLLPIITRHVAAGSTILSDKASMYVNSRTQESKLEPLGYEHYWVSHKDEWVHNLFKDIHTQNIERSWRTFKSYISTTKRTLDVPIIQSYINAFLIFANSNNIVFFI